MSIIGFERVSAGGVLRHADGSIDIAAYARAARDQRQAAMRGWVCGVFTLPRQLSTSFRGASNASEPGIHNHCARY